MGMTDGEHDTQVTIDLVELTARLGHPDHDQQAVLAWTNEDEGHLWTEAEVEELIEISAADTERIAAEA